MNVRNATESHSCKWLQRHALCIFYHSVLKDVVVRFRPSPNISASEEMHQEAAPKELHGNEMVIMLPTQTSVGFPRSKGQTMFLLFSIIFCMFKISFNNHNKYSFYTGKCHETLFRKSRIPRFPGVLIL